MKHFYTLSILCILITFFVSCTDYNEPFFSETEISADPPVNEITDPTRVNPNELNRVISDFIIRNSIETARSMDFEIETVYDSNNNPTLYIVNFANDNGFIVISASKRYTPIVAYNTYGNFCLNNLTHHDVTEWIEKTIDEISNAEFVPMDSIKRVHSQWEQYEAKVLSTFNSHISRSEISDEDLAELLRIREDSIRTWQLKGFTVYNADESIVSDDDLINNTYWLYYEHARELAVVVERRESLIIGVKNSMKTTWNQTASYNVSFPILSNGNHAYAGCTTIAAGQVMYYYKHPTYINWAGMPINSGSKITSDFLYSLAQKSNPKYNLDGTGISLSDMTSTIISFGYNAKHNNSFDLNLANSDLNSGKPIIVHSEYKDSKGKIQHHAWVVSCRYIDLTRTYKSIYTFTRFKSLEAFNTRHQDTTAGPFHYINWGWGGTYDGYYYNITNVAPGNNTDGTSLKMIYNISPK